MGFRFRKSIKLPGGFRINVSNSGVGYSWGTKGYRVTKTAKGTIRETVTIPGTGLSRVRESRAKSAPVSNANSTEFKSAKQRHGCLPRIAIFCVILAVVLVSCHSKADDSNEIRNIPDSNSSAVIESIPSEVPGVSSSPNPSPSQSTAGSEGMTKEEQARAYLSEEFNLELVDVKIDASIWQFAVTAAGISDREDQTEAPEDWDTIQQTLITAQSSTAEELGMSSQETALVLVDNQDERMLVCRAGVVKQDRYDNKATITPSDTQTSERRVWVTSSGSKYHYSNACSNMKNPKSMPISEAISKGYTACDKCA